MKFWIILSIVRDSKLLMEVAKTRKEWSTIYNMIIDNHNITDRKILDSMVPRDYVEDVLNKKGGNLFISSDKSHLRSYMMSERDEAITLLSAYQIYGGELIEETFEKGSVSL